MKAKLLIQPPVEVEGTAEEIIQLVKLFNQGREIRPPRKSKRGRSKAFNRGKTGSVGKRRKLTRKRWSDEDDMRLKEAYNKKMTLDEIAELTGRTVKAVTKRIIVLTNSGKLKKRQ